MTGFAVFFTLGFVTANMIWITTQQLQQQAVAQSPMDMMNMIMGGGNMTDGNTTMMTTMGGNMSMPFNMGVLAVPMMCTTPNQLLESLSGMFGGEMTGDDGNAMQQLAKQMMTQRMMEMMSEASGMENMTERRFQQAMNLVLCIPMMGEEMMQSMMGNGQNNTTTAA